VSISWQYFLSRSFSTFGDQVWRIGAPIFLANLGLKISAMGWVALFAGSATLLGSYLVAPLGRKYRSSSIASYSDLTEIISVGCVAGGLYFLESSLAINLVIAAYIITHFNTALWFASSEVMLARAVHKEFAQITHQRHYLSMVLGEILGFGLSGIWFKYVGLIGSALLNGVSFIPQWFQLQKFRTNETPPEAPLSTDNRIGINFLKPLLSSRLLMSLTILCILIRIMVIGIVPFIAFMLAKSNMSAVWIGIIISCSSLGELLGSLTYKITHLPKIMIQVFMEALAMVGLTGIVLIALKCNWSYMVTGAALLASGYIASRFTIQMRSIRHMTVSKLDFPMVVAGQTLLVRIGAPLGGLFYGYLLRSEVSLYSSVTIYSIGILATLLVASSFITRYKLDTECS
jgi:hypothetical protein